MTESYQASPPIIPVIDERLGYQASASTDHKMKVDKYNELLEDVYQREVELSKMKSALVDLREEIAEDTRLLNKTSDDESVDAAKSNEEAAEEDEEEGAEQHSDSSSSKKDNLKKVYKKTKGKAKGHIKRSKMADSVLDAEWDYKLDLLRSESVKKERRGSDAVAKDAKETEMIPLRAKTGLTTSH